MSDLPVLGPPSRLVMRMMEITGLDEVAEVESDGGAVNQLAGRWSTSAADESTVTLTEHLASHMQRVMVVPADEDVVDGALRLVTALARVVVRGADGVSVSLHRHGHLATVVATDQTILSMDADQYAAGEGPCVDAATSGRWFHAESLENETRWETFTPKALGLGINAILSVPLLTDDRPVGAINMYSRTARAFASRDQEIAATFAAEASLVLTHGGVGVSEDDLTERFGESLRSRETIARAQGVLMDREVLSADEAYATLCRLAVSQNRTLAELAAQVVASTQRLTRQG